MNELFKTKHPLFKEINTKFLKNAPNHDETKFSVGFNDDKTKLIVTNNGTTEEYDVFEKTDERVSSEPFKDINVKEGDSEIIFKIFETDQQLALFKGENFDRCIFLKKFAPSETNINFQEIKPSFRYSIFQDGCSMSHTTINNSNFEDCIFFGGASFQCSIFNNNDNEINVKNQFPHITFSRSVFLYYADFMYTKFESDALFEDCIFKSASFGCAEFKKYISFENSKFIEYLYLSNSTINEMILTNTDIKLLSLYNSIIKGSVNCENTEIEDADYRETFTKLKEHCIKKSDNISALYFHTKEMGKYQSELTWGNGFINKFMLSFEKIISNYGTNPFLPMRWLLGIHCVDLIIRVLFSDSYNQFKQQKFSIYNLNIVENFSSFLGIWILFKIILTSILIYEIIKSFRKFSRKL